MICERLGGAFRDVEPLQACGVINDHGSDCPCYRRILDKMGKHTAPNEVRSWENSLKRMYIVMNDPDIPEKTDMNYRIIDGTEKMNTGSRHQKK